MKEYKKISKETQKAMKETIIHNVDEKFTGYFQTQIMEILKIMKRDGNF